MSASPANPYSLVYRNALWAAAMILLAVLVMAAALYAWRTWQQFSGLREYALAAGIVAGLGATVCLAGAMRLLDAPLEASPALPWYLRWVLRVKLRLLMVAQLACMALAVGCAIVLLFGFNVPGM